MSMLFNIFPDSGSEDDYGIEDGKSHIRVQEGIKMKRNLCNQRALVNLSRVICDIAGGRVNNEYLTICKLCCFRIKNQTCLHKTMLRPLQWKWPFLWAPGRL